MFGLIVIGVILFAVAKKVIAALIRLPPSDPPFGQCNPQFFGKCL